MNTSSHSKNWQETKFGECFRIKHGYAFKGEHFSDSGSYIVLTPGNFYDEGGFKSKGDKEKYYVGEVPPGFILNKGDLIVAMTEQAEGLLGSSAIVPQSNLYLHNQRLGLVTQLNKEKLDKNFLYYLFNSRIIRNQIRASANGTKIRHTSPDRIYEVKVKLPDIITQQKIFDILSAYDRLIENNTRRIKILEEMARSLYDEWFIRYPTEATENKILKDVCELIVDCEHKTAPTQATGYPSIRTPNIGKGRLLLDNVNRVSEETYIAWTKRATPQTGDLILAREAPVGNVAIVPRNLKVCLGQRTVLIRADESQVKPYYLLFLLLSRGIQNKIISLSNGATVHHLNMKDIRNLELPEIHSLSRQNEINSILSTYYELIFNLTEKIRNLHQTRDLLLPKLISGEIDVEKLDGMGEEGAIAA